MAELPVSLQMPEAPNLGPRGPGPGVPLDEEHVLFLMRYFRHMEKSREYTEHLCTHQKTIQK